MWLRSLVADFAAWMARMRQRQADAVFDGAAADARRLMAQAEWWEDLALAADGEDWSALRAKRHRQEAAS